MKAEKARIYGVDEVGRQTPTGLPRTDDAVGLGFEVGDSEIYSDFDHCYPWSDMREVVDDKGNVFIRIPKFYVKITKNNDGTYKHQISGYRYEGFSTLFIDGEGNELDYVDVGKYEGSMDNGAYDAPVMRSVSGATVKVNITIVDYRKACMNNGRGYQQYDYLIHSIIRELFLVEFATTNTQSIMYGYANSNSAAITTGRTDEVATPSGSPESNSDGKHACKYRGIENPHGNVYKWCDGYSLQCYEDDDGDTACDIYLCFDPKKYQSEHYESPYFKVATQPYLCGDNCKTMALVNGFPALTVPMADGGNMGEYYCDYIDNDWGTVLAVGGRWFDDDDAGLWYAYGSDADSYYSYYGGRLCRKPL